MNNQYYFNSLGMYLFFYRQTHCALSFQLFSTKLYH